MKAVYIHGFAGSIHSDTITNLRKYYPELEGYPLEVDHHVDESVKKINDFITANKDVKYLIGSSLGGFYVLCSDFAGRKLVINPVLNPMSSLKKAIGVNKYRGRRENGEKEFKLTMQDLFRFKAFEPKDTPETICHYTPHDPNLGEDIKLEYQKFFANAEMTPHLRSHFTDEHYIKHKLKDALLEQSFG
jgi:predicted esterase YcpF (UPF0227 family)